MSYRDALKVFKLERELNDDETAFLNTLRKMSDAERELTVEALSPQSKKSTTKKPGKKAAVKSARAASISDAIQGTAGAAGRVVVDDDGDDWQCERCPMAPDDNVHHLATHANYHPFVAPLRAPPATGKSSSKNGESAGSSTASSGIETEEAGVAVNAGG